MNNDIPQGVGRIELDATRFCNRPDNTALPIMATRSSVLFPEVTVPLTIGREMSLNAADFSDKNSCTIGLVCQKDPTVETPDIENDLYGYGVYIDVLTLMDMPDGSKTAFVRSHGRFRINGAETLPGEHPKMLLASVSPVRDTAPRNKEYFEILVDEIVKKARAIFEEIRENPSLIPNMKNIHNPVEMVNYIASNLPAEPAEKMELLATGSVQKRAEGLHKLLCREVEKMEITKELMQRTHESINQSQRNNFLQHQLDTIREELYGNADNDAENFRKRLGDLAVSEETQTRLNKEIEKLDRLNPTSADYSVQYSYLDTVLSLPWNEISNTRPESFAEARKVLDRDHFGIAKVKQRILEQLAVAMTYSNRPAPIICLVGPPGVGKTSIGKSIAEALGRKYQRISLGGVHDEAEIRGHRRTYIGAMPGRFIDAIKRAGVADPVLVLDEIDKLGQDYKGDPSSALLEVLDPEQNCHFHDNYVDLDFDMSDVMFIATANSLAPIPKPLLDRMEVIQLEGYLVEEKIQIARRHIWPKLVEDFMVDEETTRISDSALRAIITQYTSESGVRQLEKKLADIIRKSLYAVQAKESFPTEILPEHLYDLLGLPLKSPDEKPAANPAGVVTGLAWTETGGEILLAEALLSGGKGNLTITGNLGNVMKESATIAMQWIRGHASALGIDPKTFTENDFHVHFPEGAIPKDGPSAGITIATALVSAIRRQPVAQTLAMTGEITLRGAILPVGGIKEKILAAKRHGVTDIALSDKNRRDIDDIPSEYTQGLTFHYFTTVSQLMEYALK